MIKFKSDGDKPIIGLGLSDGNIKKLKNGKPIYIMREELGIDFNLLIFWGHTEEDMTKQLIQLGMITDETDIKTGFIDQ